jgi:uracil-DNA glycosylase
MLFFRLSRPRTIVVGTIHLRGGVTMPELIDELAAFYQSQNIAVDNFACPHQAECDRVTAAAGQSLHHGSEAHIGSRYGDPFRIVVVSLSDKSGSARLSDHDEYERGLCTEWDLNPHLVGTKEILEAVLAPEITEREVFRHFALTRAAKCALVGEANKPPDACFWHCRQFVLPELEALRPDLIVTQGREAWWALEEHSDLVPDTLVQSLTTPDMAGGHPALSLFEGCVREYVRILRLGSRPVVLLKLVHPAARGGQWALMKNLNAVSALGWIAKRLVVQGQAKPA